MTKSVYLITLFLFAFVVSGSMLAAELPLTVTARVVDDEYDRYKKKGDDFFKEGKYVEARKQYQNCLEVPGFENDSYAKGQIEKCNTGITLRQQADEALRQNKGREAVGLLNQLLTLNSNDALSKERLADYFEREGNQFYNQQRYTEAKDRYEQALKYTVTRQESLRLQIQNCDKNLALKIPKRVGFKLFTGAVAIGAGAYAILLRSDYQSKMTALNELEQTTDPDGNGVIDKPDLYRQYNDAYSAAESSQKKIGLYKACIGVAAVATVAELYLLLHKPSPRNHALHWGPSSQSWGLAVKYTF